MSKISKNIKKLRTAQNMTQEELAVKIHVTRQTVSSWETGRTQPDLQIIQILAQVFCVEPEDIIYGKRKDVAEEKEKLLFGNMLITVLSVLGCLLIGTGVVMIFVKFWSLFPDLLKLITCFIPALLGQAVGIYAYVRKKESLPWLEGASVLWMLGVGVTTAVLLGQVNSLFVDIRIVYGFIAVSFLVMMTAFRTLAPLAVVHVCAFLSFEDSLMQSDYNYYNLDNSVYDILRFVCAILVQAAFVALVMFISSKLYKKESNIIRYTFSVWINFGAIVALVAASFTESGIFDTAMSVIMIAAILCFVVGLRHKDFLSPYRIFGTAGTAVMLCLFTIFAGIDTYDESYVKFIAALVAGLLPLILFLNRKTSPENIYLRFYGILSVAALFVYNIGNCLLESGLVYDEIENAPTVYDIFFSVVYNLDFVICLAALVMLVLYGAKERKLLHLNFGFILSCLCVIVKLYTLELGLIFTGLLLIACGAGLLLVNLKMVRIREKEKADAILTAEEDAQ